MVKNNFFTKGSFLLSPALDWVGQGRLKNIISVRQKKNFRAKPRQVGKKEGGLGEGIFARLLSAEGGMGWKSVSAIPALAGRQNRKIFVSLIEKILARERLKNV